MTTIKTAISLNQTLYRQLEETSQKLHISRSRLFSLALHDFFKKYRNREMKIAINEAYADGLKESEKEYLNASLKIFSKTIAKEKW